jgi:deoxyribodipyrimidine photo-lyase
VLWFRRDLRLTDNPALARALEQGSVIPVFIHAPEEEGDWPPGGASRWWLHHSLGALKRDLEARGAPLVIRRGPALPCLERLLIAETGAGPRLLEPAPRTRVTARDEVIRDTALTERRQRIASTPPCSTNPRGDQPRRRSVPGVHALLEGLPGLGLPDRGHPRPGADPGPGKPAPGP